MTVTLPSRSMPKMPSPTDSRMELRLAAERAELVFGADLLGDVDAEAEHVRLAAGDVDELVAVGDDADFAVDVAADEAGPALRLSRTISSRYSVKPARRSSGMKSASVMAGHVLAGAADGLRAVGR